MSLFVHLKLSLSVCGPPTNAALISEQILMLFALVTLTPVQSSKRLSAHATLEAPRAGLRIGIHCEIHSHVRARLCVGFHSWAGEPNLVRSNYAMNHTLWLHATAHLRKQVKARTTFLLPIFTLPSLPLTPLLSTFI